MFSDARVIFRTRNIYRGTSFRAAKNGEILVNPARPGLQVQAISLRQVAETGGFRSAQGLAGLPVYRPKSDVIGSQIGEGLSDHEAGTRPCLPGPDQTCRLKWSVRRLREA